MLIELSGSINNFAISKNTPLPARCLESFQEKEKNQSMEKRDCTEKYALLFSLWS
jgi:hypothetical protein